MLETEKVIFHVNVYRKGYNPVNKRIIVEPDFTYSKEFMDFLELLDNFEFGKIIGCDQTLQVTNNCYTYALDYIDNGNCWGMNSGDISGNPFDNLTLIGVGNAALRDDYVKKPSFWNKLGFGKQGYYEVYLVLGEDGYHWYRQDQGGKWSHKQGNWLVSNVDASGRLIRNPAKANHHYQWTNPNGTAGSLNYNQGGRFLWIRRR